MAFLNSPHVSFRSRKGGGYCDLCEPHPFRSSHGAALLLQEGCVGATLSLLVWCCR